MWLPFFTYISIIFACSATLSPTPQSPSPTTQRQQDSGFVEQLGDVSSEPLVVANTQSTIEPSETGHQEPDAVRARPYITLPVTLVTF